MIPPSRIGWQGNSGGGTRYIRRGQQMDGPPADADPYRSPAAASISNATSVVTGSMRLGRSSGLFPFHALTFAAATAFAGFFIIAVALDVFGQTFLLAKLLESLQHLLDRLVPPGSDLDRAPRFPNASLTWNDRKRTAISPRNGAPIAPTADVSRANGKPARIWNYRYYVTFCGNSRCFCRSFCCFAYLCGVPLAMARRFCPGALLPACAFACHRRPEIEPRQRHGLCRNIFAANDIWLRGKPQIPGGGLCRRMVGSTPGRVEAPDRA